MRDPMDRYYTPDPLAEACVRVLFRRLVTRRWQFGEPCCGGGAFGRAAQRVLPQVDVFGCDIDPAADPGFELDRCRVEDWRGEPRLEVLATNPPYRDIYACIDEMRALQRYHGALRLGLLLRATTIEQVMCSDDPPSEIHVTRQRAKWGGEGGASYSNSDTCGIAFMVWELGPGIKSGTTIEGMPDWRPRGRSHPVAIQ